MIIWKRNSLKKQNDVDWVKSKPKRWRLFSLSKKWFYIHFEKKSLKKKQKVKEMVDIWFANVFLFGKHSKWERSVSVRGKSIAEKCNEGWSVVERFFLNRILSSNHLKSLSERWHLAKKSKNNLHSMKCFSRFEMLSRARRAKVSRDSTKMTDNIWNTIRLD